MQLSKDTIFYSAMTTQCAIILFPDEEACEDLSRMCEQVAELLDDNKLAEAQKLNDELTVSYIMQREKYGISQEEMNVWLTSNEVTSIVDSLMKGQGFSIEKVLKELTEYTAYLMQEEQSELDVYSQINTRDFGIA